MSDSGTYITKEGLEKFIKELYQLKHVKRMEVASRIQEAKELGDLSENAEYVSAKEEQSFIEGRISELENIVRNASIIKPSKSSSAQVGSTITIKMDTRELVYQIVGSSEADPSAGRISNESPIGKAFLGKKPGDEVEVEVPSGKMLCKIVEIN